MVRGKLTFISGGVRSGKSAYAEQLLVQKAHANGGRLVYIASGTATDSEMAERIKRHQEDRSSANWTTYEQPKTLETLLPFIRRGDFVLWDCMTTWLANELYDGWETGTPCIGESGCMEQKEKRLHETIDTILSKASQFVIVSNEVLDEYPSSHVEVQLYSEWLGRLHQKIVNTADTAIEMDYGLAKVWKSR